MRRLLLAAAVTLLAAPAFASSSVDTMMACASAWNGMSSIDKAQTTYDAFSTRPVQGRLLHQRHQSQGRVLRSWRRGEVVDPLGAVFFAPAA